MFGGTARRRAHSLPNHPSCGREARGPPACLHDLPPGCRVPRGRRPRLGVPCLCDSGISGGGIGRCGDGQRRHPPPLAGIRRLHLLPPRAPPVRHAGGRHRDSDTRARRHRHRAGGQAGRNPRRLPRPWPASPSVQPADSPSHPGLWLPQRQRRRVRLLPEVQPRRRRRD